MNMVWSNLENSMIPSGCDQYECSCGFMRDVKETADAAWSHERKYHHACGYCKYSPCTCDGLGGKRH